MNEIAIKISGTDGITLDARLVRTDETAKGMVILVHGITSGKDEGGLYARVAELLARAGIDSLRFDFRGHGQSGGRSTDMTIRGETDDLFAVVSYARSQMRSGAPLGILASSFGTVATMNYLQKSPDIRTLVLWNPVLDLQHTFTHPQLPWGKNYFSKEKQAEMKQTGQILIGTFPVGKALFDEMDDCFPYRILERLTLPVLTVHGDRDACTSYDLSMRYGAPNPQSETLTLSGVGHGFGKKSPQAIDAAVRWFTRWIE